MILKNIFRALSIAVFAVGFSNAIAKPTHFTEVEAMFDDFSDYAVDDNSLEIKSTDPLVLRLSPTVVEGDSATMVDEELKRALIYGVYRPFIHTDAEKITVSVQPLLLKAGKLTLQDKPRFTITLTKEQARKAVQDVLPGKELEDLVGGEILPGTPDPDQWSDEFYDIYYKTRKPGQDAFFEAMAKRAE